jgi:hypothetical protein
VKAESLLRHNTAMDLLQHSFFTLLLMGLLARAFWRQGSVSMASSRCGWRIARGLVGGGLFSLLTLLHLVIAVKTEHWGWSPGIPAGDPSWGSSATVAGDLAGRWGAFLLAYVGMAIFLWSQCRKAWIPPSDGSALKRLRAGIGLSTGLAVALQVPWLFLHEFGPHILDHFGFQGWIGYSGLTCLGLPRKLVVAMELDTLAGLTLLLWLFQHLWDHVVTGPATDPPFPTRT